MPLTTYEEKIVKKGKNVKLYLGCALPPFHPQHLEVLGDPAKWIWVDAYVDHPMIQNWDATNLYQVEDGAAEKIYASHLLEHFPHPEVPRILSHWYDKLKKNGELIINVPDLAYAAKQLIKLEKGYLLDGYYNQFAGDNGLLSIIYGTESHDGEYHKGGFIKEYLEKLLKEAGFRDVEVVRQFDAHDMDVLIARCRK